MTFKTYHTGILFRVILLTLFLAGTLFFIFKGNLVVGGILFLLVAYSIYEIFSFLSKRFEVIDDFFESVKYRDFSRNYLEENKTSDIKRFYKGFNTVNGVVREINSEKETQYLYLQKILEMIDIGILAYEIETGKVLWMNETFQDTLQMPSFKNIKFIESRNKQVYEALMDSFFVKPTAIELLVHKESIQVLLSNSLFEMDDKSHKLIVIHNIEDTLNKTESDAWKKLLSVMTHEIMNSIAPISSLANTLKAGVRSYREKQGESNLSIEDLDAGLGSIEKRSEGLMKFAKTYRSLNKVTSLNLENIRVKDLFRDIEYLMKPSLAGTEIDLKFKLENDGLEVEADAYLLEQVLINLILNAIEACEKVSDPKVYVVAQTKLDGKTLIKVADNGPGIPNEIKEQIFVPFFTTKKKGSGIGLSLCKQIMTLHGGKIQLESTNDEGTNVSLIFS